MKLKRISSQEEIEKPEQNGDEETESDLNLKEEFISQVVVTATDWTTETLLNQLKRGNIVLEPKFQRRDAWVPSRKSKFIESLFLGLPIPQLVLAEQKNRRGSYIVIDGKQRLLSLRQFGASVGDGFERLKLSNLDIKTNLNGLTLEDIENSANLYDELTAFQNQPIRTVVVKNWPDEDYLYLLFLRLNTGSVKLSPQELRQALHPGPFVEYANVASGKSKNLQRVLGISKPDFRMRDVELFIRYFAFRRYIQQYNGNLKNFLDTVCKNLNKEWTTEQERIKQEGVEFERALETTFEIFGQDSFRKWNGDKFESRFNRAIFDIMVFYFHLENISRQAVKKKECLISSFKDACVNDNDFRTSIQTTTKSIQATCLRLSKWATLLNECLDDKVPIPKLIDGRISFK